MVEYYEFEDKLKVIKEKRKDASGLKAQTVGDLKKMLESLPDEMELANGGADYVLITEKDWYFIDGVRSDYQVLSTYPGMRKEDKVKEKKYLCLGAL